ncbi:MAG: cytochrome P450, partial [Burkholderiales bacterium]
MISRHTVEPYRVGEVSIPPGETLFFMVGAANRDPAVFPDAERFDVGRHPNPHLGFGAGIHYCVGAPLARVEAQVAFERLLHRFPEIALGQDGFRWRKLVNLRGLQSLVLSPARP